MKKAIYKGYIYIILNKINYKKYIGLTTTTIQRRFSQHAWDALNKKKLPIIDRAIKKYGKENFSILELDSIEDVNKNQLITQLKLLEKYYIIFFDSFIDWNLNGYNLTLGGEGIGIISEQTREKMSYSRMGKKNNFYGKKHKKESIEKIKKNMPDFSGPNHHFYGKKHSEISKLKMSKSKKGQKHTTEAKLKISKSHTGLKKSKKHKDSLSLSKSKDYEITYFNGKIIQIHGMNKFAKENGYSQGTLHGLLTGKVGKYRDIKSIKEINSEHGAAMNFP